MNVPIVELKKLKVAFFDMRVCECPSINKSHQF